MSAPKLTPVATRFHRKGVAVDIHWTLFEPFEPGEFWDSDMADRYEVQQLVTTAQAETYARGQVRQALEEAAGIADSMNAFSTYDAIRALIDD